MKIANYRVNLYGLIRCEFYFYSSLYFHLLLIMLRFVFLYTVTIGIILLIKEIECDPIRDAYVKNILQLLQQQQTQDQYQSNQWKYEESPLSNEDSGEDDNSHYGSLKDIDVIELIQKASHDKYKKYNSNDSNRKEKQYKLASHHDHALNVINRDDYKNRQVSTDLDKQVLEKILQQFMSQKNSQRRPHRVKTSKKRLVPSELLHPLKIKNMGRPEGADGLDDYSKIYFILNPLATQKSNSKNSLNNLLSKVLSMPSSFAQKQRDGGRKDHRFKGFMVKDDLLLRRSRRDSKEMYAPKDTIEDDYKPKRSRSDHSSRTAIPYIKHRGDIYERDN